MTSRIAMSEEKRTRLTFIGIAGLCAAGVLKFIIHFAPKSAPVSLTLSLLLAAAALTGMIAFWTNRPMKGKLAIARRKDLGTTLAFGAIYVAFATFMILSLYTSSAQVKFAGDVAFWFFLAFMQWDTWRTSQLAAEPA